MAILIKQTEDRKDPRNYGPCAAAKVVALVPAHKEGELISKAIHSLREQTRLPDRIVVVADNCTDRTPEVAKEAGAEVFVASGNRDKKGDALNQALAEVLLGLTAQDFVLVMDGDSSLVKRFVEEALSNIGGDIGTVGGIFMAARKANLVERLQHAEYVRYAREIVRGGAKVITGTGALFRVEALRDVLAARQSGKIPGGRTQVYDTLALTEDNELTLALKHLGWRCISSKECVLLTDVMPTWRKLRYQRMRWQRGAFENLRAYGLPRTTAPYVIRQAFMGIGTAAVALLLLTTLLSIAFGDVTFRPFWASLAVVFLLERLVTVRQGGLAAVAIAAVLIVEFAHALLQQAVYVKYLLGVCCVDRWVRKGAI